MEDADPLPVNPECADDSALGLSNPSLAKGECETFGHGVSDNYIRNSENYEQDDGYSDHDDGDDDQDDVGLYLALNTIPVKVELEETGGDIIVGNEEEVDDGEHSVDTAVDASQVLEGIASTSGSAYSNLDSIPRGGHLWIDFNNGIQEQRIKRKRKNRNTKSEWRSKMKGKTEDELQLIRQRNRLQKQNKRRLMHERILIESMCGIADDSYDLYEIEERKQRGEILTATEQLLLMKKRDRDRQKRRRESMTEEERLLERKRNRERKQQQRDRQKIALLENLPDEIEKVIPVPKKSKVQELTEEQAERRRVREREYKRKRRKTMTEEQLSVERQKNRERKRISNSLKRWKKRGQDVV